MLAPKIHQNRIMEASWGVLGASWGVLGASWSVLETSWGVLGASWSVLERKNTPKKPGLATEREARFYSAAVALFGYLLFFFNTGKL